MTLLSEAQLQEIKDRNACDRVAAAYVHLRRKGGGMIGPCPVCSDDRQSKRATRFECTAAGWVCAVCQDGGDVIKLVQRVEGLDFAAAVERLGGSRAIDPEEARRRDQAAAAKRAERAREDDAFRERERNKLFEAWRRGVAIPGTPAEAYLRLRGVEPPPGARLRCIPEMPYYASGKKDAEVVHRGPALLAPIIGPTGRFAGIHITYIDLGQAKGKAAPVDPETGEALPSRKVRGSKAAGRIELVPCEAPHTLVVGEGIEKVAAVHNALAAVGRDLSGWAFWTSVDLGNLGGKSAAAVPHPSAKTANGRAQRVPGPVPDLASPGIPIPGTVERLIIVGDSTSDRFTTACAIARAAARWEAEGRAIVVAWAPPGQDFDDVLRLAPDRPVACGAIAYAIDSAAAPAAAASLVPPPGPAASVPRVGQRRSAAPTSQQGGRQAAADRSSPPDAEPPAAGPAAPGLGPAAAPPAAPPSGGRSNNEPSQMGGSQDEQLAARAEGGGRRGRLRGWDDAAAGGDGLDLQLAFYPQTDLGNAERFVKRNRARLKFCAALGWLWWDGRRWAREGADERVKMAEHQTVRSIQREAAALAKDERDTIARIKNQGKSDEQIFMASDVLAAWGRLSEENRRLTPISKQAAPYMAVQPHDLDADPYRINVRNGTLVVRKVAGGPYVTLQDHDPADLITKLAPVDYDRDATCACYDAFIEFVQPGADMRRFLHAWLGLSLTGNITEQVFVFFWGKGKNGKSTLLDTVAHIAGDYGKTMPIETFINEGRSRSAGNATPDLAMLQGVRLLRASEPEKGARLAEALIKQATGGEEMPVRELHKPFYMLKPSFKLTMSGNYRPKVDGTDEGIWRRVKLVPWTVTVSEERRDPDLPEKLKAEASGILNRLLDGLCDYLDHRLLSPDDVIKATADYRAESDPLSRFLAGCTVPDPDGRVQSSKLHELFVAWSTANAGPKWTGKGFSMAMQEKGYEIKHSRVSWFLSLRATRTVNDFVDADGRPLALSAGEDGEPADSAAASSAAEGDAIEF